MKVITKSPIFVNKRKVSDATFSNADDKKDAKKADGKKVRKGITDDTLNKAGKGLDLFGKAKEIFGKGTPTGTSNEVVVNDTTPKEGMSKTTKIVLVVAGAALLITVIVMVTKKK